MLPIKFFLLLSHISKHKTKYSLKKQKYFFKVKKLLLLLSLGQFKLHSVLPCNLLVRRVLMCTIPRPCVSRRWIFDQALCRFGQMHITCTRLVLVYTSCYYTTLGPRFSSVVTLKVIPEVQLKITPEVQYVELHLKYS